MAIVRSAPYFPVADVAATIAFYNQALGFGTDYEAGSPPVFAICSRDGFGLMFRKVESGEKICPSEAQGGTWDAFFWVDDAEALHAELAARGVTIVYPPTRQEYGMLEFAVRDRDGHVLGFGQTTAEP